MLPAVNSGVGMNIGFPDVCLTPAGPVVVPVPYPSFALHAQAASFTPNIYLSMRPALNLGSVIPMTTGDEAGVAHPIIKGPGSFTAGNPKIFLQGLPAISLCCPTRGNLVNNALGIVAIPSAVNVFYSLASVPRADEQSDPYARVIDLDEALSLARVADESAVSFEVLGGSVGMLRIRTFSRAICSTVWSLLRAAGHLQALIIDLMDCPGGDVEAAILLAGDFLPRGTLVVSVLDRDGDETPRRALSDEPYDLPLAIWVNERTASAAEVLAGALAARGRALLVGAKTYGKGAVQTLGPSVLGDWCFSSRRAPITRPSENRSAEYSTYLSTGSAVRTRQRGAQQENTSLLGDLCSATVAEVLLPGGARLEGVGLTPHLAASNAEEALRVTRQNWQETIGISNGTPAP